MSETKSSTFGAIVNMSKLCVGSGILALPHSIYRGGLLFSLIMMALVAVWNSIAAKMIIDSKNYSLHKTVPSDISSPYARIAYLAMGNWGSRIADFSVVVTLLGVCTAYQITFATLMEQIPGIPLSKTMLTILCGLLVLPLCLFKSIGFLSKFSFLGLVCLLISVAVLLTYGMWNFGAETLSSPFTSADLRYTLPLFPSSILDMTVFVGVATFCYGVCSMVCQIEENMEHPGEFQYAVNWSLFFVWAIYGLIGILGAILYLHDPVGIQDNILLNLPQDSMVAIFVRLSMAMVCVLTFPLAFLSPAEILESKCIQGWDYLYAWYHQQYGGYSPIPISSTGTNSHHSHNSHNSHSSHSEVTMDKNDLIRYINRILLLVLCTVLASYVPCFEMVISVLGSFTVAILSFVLPPILNLYLVTIPSLQTDGFPPSSALPPFRQSSPILPSAGNHDDQHEKSSYPRQLTQQDYYKDLFFFGCGIALSAIATYVTVSNVIHRVQNGLSCTG